MKTTSPALHLLLVLVLLLGGLPGIAGSGMTGNAMAGMTSMEECPMTKASGHAQVAYQGEPDRPSSAAENCPDGSCDHACLPHGGATPSLVVSFESTPASSAALLAYSAELSSLSSAPPFRPPIV